MVTRIWFPKQTQMRLAIFKCSVIICMHSCAEHEKDFAIPHHVKMQLEANCFNSTGPEKDEVLPFGAVVCQIAGWLGLHQLYQH